MTVLELINKLEAYGDTLRVVVDGYEGGVRDIDNPTSIEIALDVNTEWYYGKHEQVEDYKPYPDHIHEVVIRIG